MAYALGLVTYKDFAGVSRSFRAWISDDGTPVVLPGEVLFDHLGNTLTLDVGAGVGALKTVAMTATQVLGYDDHGTPITGGSNRPLLGGVEAVANLAGRTLVAAGTVARHVGDRDGALITRPQAGLGDLVTGNASNTDGLSTPVIAAGAAGVKHYLAWVHLTNTHATQFAYVEIKDGTTVKDTIPVPPVGGVVVNYGDCPIPGTAATAWNFDPSAATTTIICAAGAFKSAI